MTRFLAALLFCLASSAQAETCIASVYSTHDHDQNGAHTASGIALNDAVPSVAHKTLPLRSYVTVANLGNGVAGRFRITDRGPYVSGRCIDLSRAAAILLGCHGLCKVNVHD